MAKKILIVDDKQELRSLLKSYLSQEGFEIALASNGQEALYVARHEKPDLIILDIMMPEMGGYEFMRIYTGEADTPIILLTAKVDENDKVLGLEIGADDYITKPFSLRELTARVRAVLRRQAAQHVEQDILREADIVLDRTSHTVALADKYIDLTPSEFEILATLMASPGRAYSRMELLDRLQGAAYEGYARTIDVHMRNLRSKLGDEKDGTKYIETVYGTGYRFNPQL